MGTLPPTEEKDVLPIAVTNALKLKERLEGRKDTSFWLMILEDLSMVNWLVREARSLIAEACGEGSCFSWWPESKEGCRGPGTSYAFQISTNNSSDPPASL